MNQPYDPNQFTNQNQSMNQQPAQEQAQQQPQGYQPPAPQQQPAQGYQPPAPQQTQGGGGNSIYDQVAESKPTEGGVYPKPGIYPLVFVDAVKMIRTRKKEDMFVAELCILNSECEIRPAGSRMSWCANFKHDAAAGNVKAFLAAAMNIPVDNVDADGMRFACSEKNPLHSRLLRLEASDITTEAGKPFTLCKWHVISDEHQARAMEYFAAAGFGVPGEDIPF